jgi:hypothetical protein
MNAGREGGGGRDDMGGKGCDKTYPKCVPSGALKFQWLDSSLDSTCAPPSSVQPVAPSSKDPFSSTLVVPDCLRSALGAARAVVAPRRARVEENFMVCGFGKMLVL